MPQRALHTLPNLAAEIIPLVHKLGASVGLEGHGTLFTFMAARIGEGTTTVTRSFAEAFHAETGKKVLLIEAGEGGQTFGDGIVERAANGEDISAALTHPKSGYFYRPMGCRIARQNVSGPHCSRQNVLAIFAEKF